MIRELLGTGKYALANATKKASGGPHTRFCQTAFSDVSKRSCLDLCIVSKSLEKYIEELIERGEHSRVMILSGCHGMETGEDGMNSLDCLSDSVIRGKSQTRGFYEDWLRWFKLSVEGEDPRVHDPNTGEVTGINASIKKPEWAGRVPGRVPTYFKGIKEKMSNIVVSIVDIAFYHGKPETLIADIEKFSPSSLILDWCFTREGHTYKLLTSAGLISQIIL